MKGTEFVLRSIAALGVEHLFMFVGGLVDPFLPEACAGVVTPIVCANEAGVGYAADGYARKFGAMLVIGGPGTFNTVGAIGAASADGEGTPPPPWELSRPWG
jgi:thiamine pyrophosphate-dependent acetolactate synthase large subunit-like protein